MTSINSLKVISLICFIAITSMSCTRSTEGGGSQLTFQMPSSRLSTQSNELLSRVIINIREPNGALIERFSWVHPCDDNQSNSPECQQLFDPTTTTAVNDPFQPPPFVFDAEAGRAYFIQVLGVYLEDPGASDRMLFKYDEETTIAQDGDTPVFLTLANISITDKEVRLIGRYLDTSGVGPTGILNVSFQPETGTFPMELFDEVIVGGWFNLFALDGAQFTYKLGNTVLFEGLDPTPGSQPSITDETGFRKRLLVPQSYRQDFEDGSSIPTYDQQDGGEVIMGFFGPYVLANPTDFALCYDDVNEQSIDGMFVNPSNSTPLTFDTQLSYNPDSIRPFSTTGGIGLNAGEDCSTIASNHLTVNYTNFDGWVGGLGGFLSAYKDQNSGSTISTYSDYLQTTSSTVISGGERFEMDWEYLPGVYGSAISGTDVFVVDTNRENEFRETEYWDCGLMATQAQNFSGLSNFGNITRFTANSESSAGGNATVEVPQSWLDTDKAEAVLCPYRTNGGSKSYLPAGVGNHGFGSGCSGCSTVASGPTPTTYYDFSGTSLDADFTFARGGTSSTYIASDGTMSVVGANIPRFDHDPVPPHAPLGLLLEKARTNQVSESEVLNSAFWGSSTIVTADTDTDPRTNLGADRLQDAGGALEFIESSTMAISNSQYYTASFFIKKTGPNTHWPAVSIGFSGGTTQSALVILDTQTCFVFNTGGTVFFNQTGHDFNTYCRFSVTGLNTGSNTSAQIRVYPAYNLDGSVTANAAATGSNVFWGVQFEESRFPTSYIPTSGASLSRLADYIIIDSATAGTRFASADRSFVFGAKHTAVAFEDDMNLFNYGLSGNIGIRHSNSASFNIITNGGGALAGPSSSSWPTDTHRNFGVALADNNSAYSEDGSIISTDTTLTIPTLSGDFILGSAASGTFSFNGHITFMEYYNQRLSDSDLNLATQP